MNSPFDHRKNPRGFLHPHPELIHNQEDSVALIVPVQSKLGMDALIVRCLASDILNLASHLGYIEPTHPQALAYFAIDLPWIP
jgi:hypothetical protein